MNVANSLGLDDRKDREKNKDQNEISRDVGKQHNGGVDAAARIKSTIGNWKSAMSSRYRRSHPTICYARRILFDIFDSLARFWAELGQLSCSQQSLVFDVRQENQRLRATQVIKCTTDRFIAVPD